MTALWTEPVVRIYQALDGQVRLVGGCVRDFVLGRKPADIDLAVALPPRTVLKKLKQHHIPCRPVTLHHGVVLASLAGQDFEITSLRYDAYVGRREKITFITDFEQDALRRDFTFNALSMDRSGQIYDYFDGISDLKNKRVRFIGDPMVRLWEDALRIYRYVRFWSFFGGEKPDSGIINLFPKLGQNLAFVSVNRRQKEIFRILMSPRVTESLDLLNQTGVLSYIIPEADLIALGRLLAEKPTADLAERLRCVGHVITDKERSSENEIK